LTNAAGSSFLPKPEPDATSSLIKAVSNGAASKSKVVAVLIDVLFFR
jgi:hypothetical protein